MVFTLSISFALKFSLIRTCAVYPGYTVSVPASTGQAEQLVVPSLCLHIIIIPAETGTFPEAMFCDLKLIGCGVFRAFALSHIITVT